MIMIYPLRGKLPNLLATHCAKLPFFEGGAKAEILRVGLANIAIKVSTPTDDYLVKFAVAPASKPSVFIQADYEKNISEKIQSLGISPKFLSSGRVRIGGRDLPYSIQEFIEGREINYSKDLQSVARLLHRLHAKTHGKQNIASYSISNGAAYLKRQAGKDILRISGNHPLLELAKTALESVSKPFLPTGEYLSLIHNDLTPENVLVSKKRPYLIDWGWAMEGPAAFDLCNFLSPFTTSWGGPRFLDDSQMRLFLGAYFKGYSRSDSMAIFSCLRKYWLAYNSLIANWIRNEFLPAHPMRQKLHFSDPRFLDIALKRVERAQILFDKPDSI